MSYPRDVPEVASWSNALVELGQEILPYNDNKYKIWVAIGSLVLTLGTIISPFAQWILGLPSLVWLGKISFPLYLLHGTFIRSLFAWVLFWGQTLGPSLYDENMQRYPLPSAGWIAFSVVCLMVPLLLACHFWVKYFEPFFDKIIMRVEKFMVRKADEQERSQSHRRGYLSRLRAIWRGVALVVKHGGLPDATATPDSLDLDDYETSGLLHEMQECSPIPLGPEEDALFDGFETTPLDGHDTGAPSAVDGNKIEHSSTSF
ncbi:hypothetical protein MMC10_006088 [Thelotrema lepadinum]|nr:hypothetical protein [Thelotrema lepadinum]